jgi:hypothetical protein
MTLIQALILKNEVDEVVGLILWLSNQFLDKSRDLLSIDARNN